MAWYYRTYGDVQYHGEYFEECHMCFGKKRITVIEPDVTQHDH